MGVMIREWPVKVSFLELTQDIARVQTIVRTCDCRDERDSPQEVPIEPGARDTQLETNSLRWTSGYSYAVSYKTAVATYTVVLSVNSKVQFKTRFFSVQPWPIKVEGIRITNLVSFNLLMSLPLKNLSDHRVIWNINSFFFISEYIYK